MKKILFVLLAICTFHFANAQEFHFMPRIGVNFANISNSGGDMKPGVNVGFAVELPLLEKLSIEPGIYYSMQGTKASEYVQVDDMKLGGDVKMNMDYLNIPIYAKYYIYEGFNVFAGPQFGFNVRSKAKISAIGFDGSTTYNFKDAVNTFDFAIGIGAGYQFDMGINVSLNYNIGLTNTMKSVELDDFEFETSDKYRNGVLQLSVGYRF